MNMRFLFFCICFVIFFSLLNSDKLLESPKKESPKKNCSTCRKYCFDLSRERSNFFKMISSEIEDINKKKQNKEDYFYVSRSLSYEEHLMKLYPKAEFPTVIHKVKINRKEINGEDRESALLDWQKEAELYFLANPLRIKTKMDCLSRYKEKLSRYVLHDIIASPSSNEIKTVADHIRKNFKECIFPRVQNSWISQIIDKIDIGKPFDKQVVIKKMTVCIRDIEKSRNIILEKLDLETNELRTKIENNPNLDESDSLSDVSSIIREKFDETPKKREEINEEIFNNFFEDEIEKNPDFIRILVYELANSAAEKSDVFEKHNRDFLPSEQKDIEENCDTNQAVPKLKLTFDLNNADKKVNVDDSDSILKLLVFYKNKICLAVFLAALPGFFLSNKRYKKIFFFSVCCGMLFFLREKILS